LKTIIALCGAPGSGKSTYRTTNPETKDLPYLDVADIYAEYGNIRSEDAYAELLARLLKLLADHDKVVIEASHPKNHWQRTWLTYLAEMNGANVDFREFNAPAEECLRRVKAQYKDAVKNAKTDKDYRTVNQYYQARIEMLERISRIEASRQSLLS